MKKYYLLVLLLLSVAIGVSEVSAQTGANMDTSTDSSVKTGNAELNAETRTQVRLEGTDLRTIYETQKARIGAQRQMIRSEAEARKAAAVAKGDDVEAARAEMKLTLEARWAQMDARRDSMKVEAEARRTEAQSNRVEFRQNIAKRKVANVTRYIMATIERLDKIVARIESRISKIKAAGGATLEAEGFVASAMVHLSDARVSAAAFVQIDLSSSQAADNFERIRALVSEVREHIRAAREDLMLAVRSLRTIEIDAETNTAATSTTSVNQ